MPPHAAQILGEFASALTIDAIPTTVREQARTALMDTAGVVIGAAALDEAQPLLAYIDEAGGRPEASVVGLGRQTSLRWAAFGNAWLADLLDYEDTLKHSSIHPSATVMPAALAVGERDGLSGAEILTAIIAGYEVGNRLARAVIGQGERGFLATGTSGALAAAAAAGRALNLTADQLTNAICIAGFVLPISGADTLWDGYSAKPIHAATAAATGMEAALLAKRGFTGGPLEGGKRGLGYFKMVSDSIIESEITDGLGEQFTLGNCSFKAYPTCGHTHGAVDVAIELAPQVRGRLDQVQRVTIRTYGRIIDSVGCVYTDTSSTLTQCQFSLPYTVAAALMDGEMTTRQLSAARRTDPAVHALAARVHTIEDPAMSARYPATFPYSAEVELTGGETLTASVEFPRGMPQRPFTVAELRAKFDALVEPVLGRHGALGLAGQIERIEQADGFRWPAVADRAGALAGTPSR